MKKIVILLTIISICSCSDFLYQEPDEQISIKEQFSTKKGLLQAVNGMYYSVEAVVSGKYFVYADLLGGNISFTPSSDDKIVELSPGSGVNNVYDFNDTEADSDFESFYEECYDIVNQANLVLEYVQDVPDLSENEINQVKAEALSVRVFMHFLVSQLYAQNYNYSVDASHLGIIYNTRTLIAGVDYPKRGSIQEAYGLMKADLNLALTLFTNDQALNYGPGYSYFNEVTTKALYAKIALHMNDWDTALEYSNEVISTSGVQLMDSANYITEWEKDEEPVSEVIMEFSAPRDSEGEVSSSVAHGYYSYVSTTNYNDFVASGDLMNLYSTEDHRKELFVEAVLPTSINGVIVDQAYYFTKKFQGDPGTIFIRLSEVYLIRAEANVRSDDGNLNDALSDLNEIRLRSGLAELTEATNLLEEIFTERRRELAFEGHLLFDIMRFQKNIERNLGCLSTTCNLTYPSNYFILPIPASSTSLNENMKQNEGY